LIWAPCARLPPWPITSPLKSGRFSPGTTQLLALAPRLTEGVADWRDPQAVLRAVRGWVQSSLAEASQPGRAVYVAVADGRVAGIVTVCEQKHFSGQIGA
jgi:hypothetical protein